ncbi:DUF3883 domain-containing protein [Pengzhenrongella sp.]|jgi:hypothetical protein|uniref:DUF3883 domain-containing protein n=1 Tax=Pengzhenrongella sp. TaxID=2888820 RepID=UPI002F95BE5D
MGNYIFCVRYEDASNWQICKEAGLLGIRTNPQGKTSATATRAGDIVYIWRGGSPKPGSGLLARVRITAPALRAKNVPWPEPDLYSYVIPFALDEELKTPIRDSFPGNKRGERFGFMNSDLQKSLRPVSADSARRLSECFRSGFDSSAIVIEQSPVATKAGGWSSDQDLIRRIEQAAISAARGHLRGDGWREVRDRQQDGCGYDLLYEHPDGRQRLVEVKGTGGAEVRFMLTRLEHSVLSHDPSGRIYVVLDALGEARVEVLDWTDVEGLGVKPERWQVG